MHHFQKPWRYVLYGIAITYCCTGNAAYESGLAELVLLRDFHQLSEAKQIRAGWHLSELAWRNAIPRT